MTAHARRTAAVPDRHGFGRVMRDAAIGRSPAPPAAPPIRMAKAIERPAFGGDPALIPAAGGAPAGLSGAAGSSLADIVALTGKVGRIAGLLDRFAPVFELIAEELAAEAGPPGAGAPPLAPPLATGPAGPANPSPSRPEDDPRGLVRAQRDGAIRLGRADATPVAPVPLRFSAAGLGGDPAQKEWPDDYEVLAGSAQRRLDALQQDGWLS
jgi:hypothetical protein